MPDGALAKSVGALAKLGLFSRIMVDYLLKCFTVVPRPRQPPARAARNSGAPWLLSVRVTRRADGSCSDRASAVPPSAQSAMDRRRGCHRNVCAVTLRWSGSTQAGRHLVRPGSAGDDESHRLVCRALRTSPGLACKNVSSSGRPPPGVYLSVGRGPVWRFHRGASRRRSEDGSNMVLAWSEPAASRHKRHGRHEDEAASVADGPIRPRRRTFSRSLFEDRERRQPSSPADLPEAGRAPKPLGRSVATRALSPCHRVPSGRA